VGSRLYSRVTGMGLEVRIPGEVGVKTVVQVGRAGLPPQDGGHHRTSVTGGCFCDGGLVNRRWTNLLDTRQPGLSRREVT